MNAGRGTVAFGRLRGNPRTPLLIAGAFAVLVVVGFTVVLLSQTERSVFGRVPILDEVYYLDRAAAIAGGDLLPDDPYFMSPLYPLFVAAAGGGVGVPESRVFAGSELRWLRLAQLVCWFVTAALVHVLARRLVPAAWGGRARNVALWLPVGLLVLYRPAAVYAMTILLEVPLVTLVVLLVVLLVPGAGHRSGARRAAAAGVVLGLAVLLRGTVLLVGPLAALALWRAAPDLRARYSGLLSLVAGTALVLLVPVLHNSLLAGYPVGPSLNGGVNFYIGNGPEANGFYVAAVPGDWRRDPAGRAFLAERLGRTEVTLAEADRIWSREAWRSVAADPARSVRLFARKIWLHLQGWEIDQLTPLSGWRAAVPVLAWLAVPYALLVVLGMAGLVAVGRRRPFAIVVAVLLVLILGQSVFFVVSRYRLVLVPFWALLAGFGVVELARRHRVVWVAAVVAGLLTVPWGLNGVRESWSALAEANAALRCADVGMADGSSADLARAAALYRSSLAGEPSRSASWLGLAAVLQAQGLAAEREAALREGVAAAADPGELQKLLLALELERGGTEPALELVRAILARRPRDADTLHNAAVLWFRTGRTDEALSAAGRLREFHPRDPRGYLDAGVLLARTGRLAEAAAAFRDGLDHCPGNPDLEHNLALVDGQK